MGFAYDGFDRLSTTSYPLGSAEALTYDADSNVTLRCTRAGLPIAYTYDTLNRLGTKTTAAPGTACTAAPSATVVTYAYDLAGRRTGVSDTSAAIQPIATPGSSIQYATLMIYDALNRPTGVSWSPSPSAVTPAASSVTFAHSYNAVNQRTGQTVTDTGANVWIDYPTGPAATTAYTANALNQYTAVAAVTPAYDGNGNTADDGVHRYGYDPENRLVSLSPSGSGTACVTACYGFDGRGRRKTKTVGTATTVSITDADNREVLEYDGSTGAILRWYAYGLGPNALLNQMDVAGGTRATLLPDQLGSIIAKLDSGVGTVGAFAYRSYGKSSSTPSQFGYTGQRVDAESGTYYYRARHYSPGWGRFLQADPIGHAGGLHLYAYTDNDPVNLIDPNGTCGVLIVNCVGAIIGGVSGGISGALAGYHSTGTWRGTLIGGGAGLATGAVIGFVTPWAVEGAAAAGGAIGGTIGGSTGAIVGAGVSAGATVLAMGAIGGAAGAVSADVATTGRIDPRDVWIGAAIGAGGAIGEAMGTGVAAYSGLTFSLPQAATLGIQTAIVGTVATVGFTCTPSNGCGPDETASNNSHAATPLSSPNGRYSGMFPDKP